MKFVRDTHYVFSVGKDRVVKYWDADKFELLLTLEGHHAEVWCMSISHRGDFLVTGSHDRSIRRWDRTDEPFFLEVYKALLLAYSCNLEVAVLTHLLMIWLIWDVFYIKRVKST